MDDLIYRSQAMEALRELVKEKFTIQDWFEFYIKALIEAEDKIAALPGAERWIPVGERLPGEDELKDNDWFLGVVSGKVGNLTYKSAVIIVCFDPSTGWFLEDNLEADITVSHWMMLPDPPGEVEE